MLMNHFVFAALNVIFSDMPSFKVYFAPQSPDQLAQIEQEAIRLSEEIKAEYWAVSAKSGERWTRPVISPESSFSVSNRAFWLFSVPGEGIRDFFSRVASLTFEANVLAELERSGSRHIKDIISESLGTL